jgi:hypothetical protein
VCELQQELEDLKHAAAVQINAAQTQRDTAKSAADEAQQIIGGIDPILRTVSDCRRVFDVHLSSAYGDSRERQRRQALEIFAQVIGIPVTLSDPPPDTITGPDGVTYERRL